MSSSKFRFRPAKLMAFIGCLAAQPMTAAAEHVPSPTIVLTGTVGSIFQVDAPPPSTKNWGVQFQVEKVKRAGTPNRRSRLPSTARLEPG
jgi:hypothetical protein